MIAVENERIDQRYADFKNLALSVLIEDLKLTIEAQTVDLKVWEVSLECGMDGYVRIENTSSPYPIGRGSSVDSALSDLCVLISGKTLDISNGESFKDRLKVKLPKQVLVVSE